MINNTTKKPMSESLKTLPRPLGPVTKQTKKWSMGEGGKKKLSMETGGVFGQKHVVGKKGVAVCWGGRKGGKEEK